VEHPVHTHKTPTKVITFLQEQAMLRLNFINTAPNTMFRIKPIFTVSASFGMPWIWLNSAPSHMGRLTTRIPYNFFGKSNVIDPNGTKFRTPDL
jgi:hypothetical protein